MLTRWTGRIAVLCVVVVSAAGAAPTTAPEAPKQVAHVKLTGSVAEGPAAFSLFDRAGGGTLRGYVDRLGMAARDENVDAVIVTIDVPQLGWSQMFELRSAFGRIRRAGKPLWVYLEQAGGVHYLLATGADRIVLAPGGYVHLVGLELEMLFVKGLLDKIGIQADMVQVGRFKGAEEPFTRTEPSPELLGEMNRLIDGLYDRMVQLIAEGRALRPARVKALIDGGPYLADDAVKARLVDSVAGRADLVAALEKRLGDKVAINRRYGIPPGGPKIDLANPFALLKLLMGARRAGPAGDRIALVYIDGVIVSGKSEEGLFGGRVIGSESIRRAVDKARWDPNVKAVVVRIDSPGGSALASDVIWRALRRAGAAKPIVVSVGDLGASGGYYVASAGRTIFAEPTSLVGSIGVIGGKFVVGPLLDKIGVTTTSLTRGANAALFDAGAPFTDRQRLLVREQVEKVYRQFLKRVGAGRGRKIRNLDAVAQGRVFLGARARANGMIDRLGGLDEAVRFAAAEANIEKYHIEVVPPPKSLMDLLTQAFGEEEEAGSPADWQRWLLGPRNGELELLARLLPRRIRRLSQQLIIARQLQSEQVLAAWPVAAEIK